MTDKQTNEQTERQTDGHCYCVKPPCGGGLINGINKADLGKLRRRERSEVRSDLGTRFVLCEKTRHFHLQLITFNDGLLSIIGINYRTINYYQSINQSNNRSVSQLINGICKVLLTKLNSGAGQK